jgi:hypothetical protein
MRVGATIAAALALCACGRGTTVVTTGNATAPTAQEPPSLTATPVDHLAPGELVEGTQQAFGVALPREATITRSEPGTIYAIASVGVHPLVRYLRSRLLDSHLVEGDTFATFDHVKLHDKQDQVFRIDISAVAGGAALEWDNVTPPPAPNLPDETARWRAVGLSPQGKILDPTHLD